jgi:CDP-4-dehydro-6-deoxyglucose reductase
MEAKILSIDKVGDKLVIKLDAKLNFKPGNTIDVIFNNDKRTFSIASSPMEDFLMFATKIRNSAFKQRLSTMKVGDTLTFEGPFEDEFVIKDSDEYVFLTKGIGITPLRSMILYLLREKPNSKITLFYEPDDDGTVLFKEDLEKVAKFEKPSADELRPYQNGLFYISGMPTSTKEYAKIVLDAGGKPGKIIMEPFSGYP